MLLQIPDLLTPEEVTRLRELIDAGQWVDGNVTSGSQSRLAKRNLQLPQDSPEAIQAGAMIREAIGRNPLAMAGALPHTVFPPLFNRYGEGHAFGAHIDNAVRFHRDLRIRTDLSATVFLEPPEAYDGGELVIEDTFGVHMVKLPAGHMVLYPSSSVHRVEPVTRGERVASFFWIQSLVRDDARRTLLFDMDIAIQKVAAQCGQDDPAVVSLTGAYHNLLRMWCET